MMRLDEAVALVVDGVRAPGGCPRTPAEAQEVADAADVVEHFFSEYFKGADIKARKELIKKIGSRTPKEAMDEIEYDLGGEG